MPGYVMNRIAQMRQNWKATNDAYEAAYRRCFEGTPEEIAIRLEAWDSTHRITRSGNAYHGYRG